MPTKTQLEEKCPSCPYYRYWQRQAARPEEALCSPLPFLLPGRETALSPCSADVARYVRRFERFQLAESATLLVNGTEAYPEMLAAIESAAQTVDLETYTFRADGTGKRFHDALVRAAHRGVRVRVLYDYIGSLGIADRFVRAMLECGIMVHVYHPMVLKRPDWAINRRDHRKILIVDSYKTFTGGLNVADEYAGAEDGGKDWRDTHVRLDGEAVAVSARQLFEYGWRTATPYQQSRTRSAQIRAKIKRGLHRPATLRSLSGGATVSPAICADGGVAVQIVGNREFRGRRRIHQAYLHAIRRARRYILIENAYFIPDGHIRRALGNAAARGVVVAVVVARNSDVPITACAARFLYAGLLESGVRIFEWPHSMMHAKTAVIDDAWAVVGSYNIDHRSLFHNLEVVAVVADPAFARRLRDQTMLDIGRCEEVSLNRHQSRPWYQKLLDSGAYLLHHWL